jgi:hypothetical protein
MCGNTQDKVRPDILDRHHNHYRWFLFDCFDNGVVRSMTRSPNQSLPAISSDYHRTWLMRPDLDIGVLTIILLTDRSVL